MTVKLLETLAALGSDARLVDRRFSADVAEVGAFSAKKVLSAVGLWFRLLRASLKCRSAIFFVTNRPASFLVDWLLSELLRAMRVATVNYIHTSGFSELAGRGPIWRWMVDRLLTQAMSTVCLSDRMIDDVAQWVDRSRIRIIANMVEERDNLRAKPENVLFLSNLIAEKGADTFVESAIALAPDFPAAHFVVAGATTDLDEVRGFQSAIDDAGLSGRIKLHGPASTSSKWELLAQSRVLVFPTRYRYEAQPLAIIEALSTGVPVIAFDVGAISDLIPNGIAGFVLPAGDVQGLRLAIRRVLDDDDLHASLADGARAAYERAHSPRAYMDGWARVLATLNAKQSNTSPRPNRSHR